MSSTGPERVAIVIDSALTPGLQGNTIATIGIGLGAALPQLGGRQLADCIGRRIDVSATVAVPVLQASAATLHDLLLRALDSPHRAIVVPFPAFARTQHDFADYQAEFPLHDLAEEEIHGLGLAGTRSWVTSLTGSLRLLR
jgi:Protein of unknown function (DUF2000)